MIYNGPSIYNQGGGGAGGGGYHDGGQIVDADFMKVENNAVSSYDNTSRNPINFYFEPADGEILNSIVELTTAVNSTVNVYVLRNGFYYLLGNVGGDTVNAGDEYKVNITGDSYAIEQVSGGGADPEFADVGGKNYKVKKVNGLVWLCENFENENWPRYTKNGVNYYPLDDYLFDGWRIPTKSEIIQLSSFGATALKSTTNWVSGYAGNNSSGLNIKGFGSYNIAANQQANFEYSATFILKDNEDNNTIKSAELYYTSDSISIGGHNTNFAYTMRLVKQYA